MLICQMWEECIQWFSNYLALQGGGIGDIVDIEDEDDEDNEDSRPNLEFIPSPLPSRSAPAATNNDSCCRAK